MDISWMGWTWQTAVFFCAIGALLLGMTLWQLVSPSAERKGILGLTTTRGDRFFISLLGTAYIHLAWLSLAAPDVYWTSGLATAYVFSVFRWA